MIWSLDRTNFNRNIAVIIGIDNYQNGIHRLKTAVNDAEAIANLLEQEYKYQTIRLFPSEHKDSREATLAEFNQLLFETLPKKIKPTEGDRLLFYFAGHGIARNSEDGPAGAIIPQDAQLGKWETYLPMKKLNEALSQLECHHLLVVLDCCFAGNFPWSSHRNVISELETIHREHFDRFIRYPAWQAITSAAHNQEALDYTDERGIDPHSQHSPFAKALINGLTVDSSKKYLKADLTRDGVITAPELYLYLRDCLMDKDGYSELQTAGLWPLQKHDRGEFIFTLPGFVAERLKPAPQLNKDNNPYRGLESFDEEHSELFFGRTELIEELQKFIKDKALSVVLGASGSGKSSLVKAGLIPKLRKDETEKWCILPPIRPGETPLITLNNALKEANFPEVIFTDLQQNLASSIKHWAKDNPNTKLLIFIDQSEEIITLCKDEEKRQQFFQQILTAIDAHRDKLRVVLSLRSDFEPQVRDAGFQFIPKGYSVKQTELKNRWKNGRLMVSPMTRRELREAIQKPAEARVMFFQPQELVEEIVDEVADMPGALPLLSFALSELYLKYLERQRQAKIDGIIIERTMIQEDYDKLGGVILSLTQKADEEYDKLVLKNPAYEQMIRHVMLRMIALGGGELVRRRVPLSELEYPPEKQELVNAVIDNFTDARLLVKGKDSEEKDSVEPAHDALVSGWQKLLTWKQEYEESLLLQRRLTVAAQEWDERVQNKPEEAQKGILDKTDPVLDWLDGRLWTVENKVNEIPVRLSQRLGRLYDRKKSSEEKDDQQKSSNEKSKQFLWNGNPYLNVLNETLDSKDNWLNQTEAEFVKQSLWQRRKNASWRWRIAIAVILGLSGLTVATLIAQQNTLKQEISALVETSKANILSNNPMDAMVFAVKAKKQLGNIWISKDLPSVSILGSLAQTIHHNQHGWREHLQLLGTDEKFRSTEVKFSPDSKQIATIDGNIVRLWNAATGEQLYELEGHQAHVSDVAFSPNGQHLATASGDKTVKLWNAATGEQLHELEGHQAYVSDIAFSPNGQHLATASEDKTVKLWNAATGEQLYTLWHRDKVISIDFSPNGQHLATASWDGTARLWNASTGEPLHTFTGHSGWLYTVAFSPSGQYLATASEDGTARLWNASTGELLHTLQGHRADVRSVAFSSDSQYLATASRDGTARIWLVDTGKPSLALRGHKSGVNSVVFSPDDRYIATGSQDSTARVWGINTQRSEEVLLQGHQDDVTNVVFSPDGRYLATASWDGTVRVWDSTADASHTLEDRQSIGSIQVSMTFSSDSQYVAASWGDMTRLWNVATGELLQTFEEERHATLSPNGKYLATASEDGTARLWEAATGKLLHTLRGHQDYIVTLAFSPSGQHLVTASADNTVRLWNVATGEVLHKLQEHEDLVWSVAFSPDGQHLATGSKDATVRVWDVNRGEVLHKLQEHEDLVWSVAFSPDGQHLATGSKDGTARIWDVNRGEWLHTLHESESQIMSVVFSPDGQQLATVSWDGAAWIWDVATGKALHTLRGHKDLVNSVAFSPDGQQLATVSRDRTAKVWHTATGELLYTLQGHQNYVEDVAFISNSQQLATASRDGTVQLWQVGDLEDLLAINCDRVRHYLKNNPNVEESDRRLCDGVPSLNENSQNQ